MEIRAMDQLIQISNIWQYKAPVCEEMRQRKLQSNLPTDYC